MEKPRWQQIADAEWAKCLKNKEKAEGDGHCSLIHMQETAKKTQDEIIEFLKENRTELGLEYGQVLWIQEQLNTPIPSPSAGVSLGAN